jgi:hypothetical protein
MITSTKLSVDGIASSNAEFMHPTGGDGRIGRDYLGISPVDLEFLIFPE